MDNEPSYYEKNRAKYSELYRQNRSAIIEYNKTNYQKYYRQQREAHYKKYQDIKYNRAVREAVTQRRFARIARDIALRQEKWKMENGLK